MLQIFGGKTLDVDHLKMQNKNMYMEVIRCEYSGIWTILKIYINPLLHRYSFLHLLQQTTFENIVAKEEIAPKAFQLKKCSFLSAE